MECSVPDMNLDDTFEDLLNAFESQNYWVSFFMRPCCPPPGESAARSLIEHLCSDIDARPDLSPEQKQTLKGIAHERLAWYGGLSVRRAS